MEDQEFILLRTPLLSIECILSLPSKQALVELTKNEVVREAIIIASLTTYEHLLKDPTLSDEKLYETVLKYVLRMGSRCTPFGLFAGNTICQLSKKTNINLTDRKIVKYHNLDFQIVRELSQHLEKEKLLENQLKYWPNTSLYVIGSKVRYIEVITIEKDTKYYISEVEVTSTLLRILDLTKYGCNIKDLLNNLSCNELNNVKYNEIKSYIKQLIIDQIIVSELSPNVTGTNSFNVILEITQKYNKKESKTVALQKIHLHLHNASNERVKEDNIRNILENEVGINKQFKNVIQCDSFFTGGFTQFSKSVLNELKKTFLSLSKTAREIEINDLENFKNDFKRRYEGREMPLTVVMDSKTGIGYGSIENSIDNDSLIQHITITKSKPVLLYPEHESFLLNIYSEWINGDSEIIILEDKDFLKINNESIQLPESYYALGCFLATDSKAIDKGDYRFILKGLAGPSAFNLMGRYSQCNSELADKITNFIRKVEDGDSNRIYAEIVHDPLSRAGNILQRAHLYKYEIPYLSRSILPEEQHIYISDLLISISKENKIVLRSKRLNKEVIPRFTTAYNYTVGLPLNKLLCDLQFQDNLYSFDWQWGQLSNARRLPRVQYKKVILHRAQWHLYETDVSSNKSDEENVLHLRNYWKIPKLVAIVQNDQELFLNLESSICHNLLVSTIRRLKEVVLIEWLQTPENCWIDGPEGKLTHEVILPYINKPSLKSFVRNNNQNKIQRTFLPGSEWFYLKIYCNPHGADDLIVMLSLIAKKLTRDKIVTKWFFVRYKDPYFHIRIRFCVSETFNTSLVLNACKNAIENFDIAGETYQIQIDTYQREIERYQENLISITESLFWIDSSTVTKLLRKLSSDELYLKAAILGVNGYLDNFGYNIENKIILCQKNFESLFQELGASNNLMSDLAKKYRINERLLYRLLTNNNLLKDEIFIYKEITERSLNVSPHIPSIKILSNNLDDYITDINHMFLNRLYSQDQLVYELIIYHHLNRIFKSMLVHTKKM